MWDGVARVAEWFGAEGGAGSAGSVLKDLKDMQARHPCLALPGHDLYVWVQDCDRAISAGDVRKARDHLLRIQQNVEQEESMLTAAFHLFKPAGQDHLTRKEVKLMLEYLGFPAQGKDVDKLLTAVDSDGDRKMSLAEFHQYVARMGGSFQLFEVRRKQTAGGIGFGARMQPPTLRLDLLEVAITDNEQAYWQLVAPISELHMVAQLDMCQKRAIRHIRVLAKSNHERALPQLQRRVRRMGYTDSQLWMTLAWIRELAPILVHVNLDKMLPFMEKDTHYRNQFETASSGGLLDVKIREIWEKDLFGGCYESAAAFQRCKYGVLNSMNDSRGVVKCAQYGDSYVVLRDVRLRCTLSPEDSANLKADRLAVLDYYAHVLTEYNREELRETVEVAISREKALVGDSGKVGRMKYKETQIHGAISFARDIQRLVAHQRHRQDGDVARRLEAVCKKHGWQLSWADQERERMQKEEKEKLGADAWEKKMHAIMAREVPDARGVPQGLCRKGCGRRVAPGLTRSGNPYSTCCRGCVLGFGHDLCCGSIDPELLGPGLCENGCGRPVHQGAVSTPTPSRLTCCTAWRARAVDKGPSDRSYNTCCRSCAQGHHDPWCGSGGDGAETSPGLCRMGCGRTVAVCRDGRQLDTCCKGCALRKGHTRECRRREAARA